MATLQKFKFLATQCAIVASPCRSPNTSPALQLPHRKTTLRELLKEKCRSGNSRLLRRSFRPDRQKIETNELTEVKKKGFLSHTLKDLFVSSPLFEDVGSEVRSVGENGNGGGSRKGMDLIGRGYQLQERGFGGRSVSFEALANGLASRTAGVSGVGFAPRRVTGLRYRLLRRAWKPVLVTIPE